VATVESVKAEVQKLLVSDLQLNAVKLTQSGGFSFQVDSTEVFVDIFPAKFQHADTIVAIYAPIGLNVPITDGLCRYVAFNADGWVFGHLGMSEVKDSPGLCHVSMNHNLVGDFMDPPEFKAALLGVAGTAEDLDDKITAQFGGHRAHEPVAG
jgi:hypothetical protein